MLMVFMLTHVELLGGNQELSPAAEVLVDITALNARRLPKIEGQSW
jgi:hypothetical protein